MSKKKQNLITEGKIIMELVSSKKPRRRSQKGVAAPSQQGAHSNTYTGANYMTDRWRVQQAISQRRMTLDQLRRELKMASPASRISELIIRGAEVQKRFIPHTRDDGQRVSIKEYWIESGEVDHE